MTDVPEGLGDEMGIMLNRVIDRTNVPGKDFDKMMTASLLVEAIGQMRQVVKLREQLAILQDRPGAGEASTLRVALRWYADKTNYEPDDEMVAAINDDGGDRARKALN